jgi:hypothetical protein
MKCDVRQYCKLTTRIWCLVVLMTASTITCWKAAMRSNSLPTTDQICQLNAVLLTELEGNGSNDYFPLQDDCVTAFLLAMSPATESDCDPEGFPLAHVTIKTTDGRNHWVALFRDPHSSMVLFATDRGRRSLQCFRGGDISQVISTLRRSRPTKSPSIR